MNPARSSFVVALAALVGLSGCAAQRGKTKLARFTAAQDIEFEPPIRDAYRISSRFGPRLHPISGRWAMHNGLDLAAPRGTPVRAPMAGYVSFSGYLRGYGKVVKIRHRNGFETLYAHLDSRRLRTGDWASRGDVIGAVGSTGRSTGNHLHFEVRLHGRPTNPERFMPELWRPPSYVLAQRRSWRAWRIVHRRPPQRRPGDLAQSRL